MIRDFLHGIFTAPPMPHHPLRTLSRDAWETVWLDGVRTGVVGSSLTWLALIVLVILAVEVLRRRGR